MGRESIEDYAVHSYTDIDVVRKATDSLVDQVKRDSPWVEHVDSRIPTKPGCKEAFRNFCKTLEGIPGWRGARMDWKVRMGGMMSRYGDEIETGPECVFCFK